MCVHREANKSARVPWESSKTLLQSDSANEKLLVSEETDGRQVVHNLATHVSVWFFLRVVFSYKNKTIVVFDYSLTMVKMGHLPLTQ